MARGGPSTIRPRHGHAFQTELCRLTGRADPSMLPCPQCLTQSISQDAWNLIHSSTAVRYIIDTLASQTSRGLCSVSAHLPAQDRRAPSRKQKTERAAKKSFTTRPSYLKLVLESVLDLLQGDDVHLLRDRPIREELVDELLYGSATEAP